MENEETVIAQINATTDTFYDERSNSGKLYLTNKSLFFKLNTLHNGSGVEEWSYDLITFKKVNLTKEDSFISWSRLEIITVLDDLIVFLIDNDKAEAFLKSFEGYVSTSNSNSNDVIKVSDDADAGVFTKNEFINAELKRRAKNDILWGSIWCGGGIVLTLAEIGYIYWGAIIFGGVQLIRGLVNYSKVNN